MGKRVAFRNGSREVSVHVPVWRLFDFGQPIYPVPQFVEKCAIQDCLTHTAFREMECVSAPVFLDPVSIFSKTIKFRLVLQA